MAKPRLKSFGISMFVASLALPAAAATPGELLRDYEAQARQSDAGFQAAAARGETFFRAERGTDRRACAGCHGADPRRDGLTRANKRIEPLAPAANAQRFTEPAKVEKWFGRNCGDVVGRACSAGEKADFVAWLITVK